MSSNLSRAKHYLNAVASLTSAEDVSVFFTPDVIFQEFPNRIAPQGRTRGAEALLAAYEQAKSLLRSQSFVVRNAIESGDEVAMELEWVGVLAIPMMGLKPGSEMKAFIGMFLTFRDGRIASQRNYDCYPPFDGGHS
jgi:ketosteroid isomerase-like protein